MALIPYQVEHIRTALCKLLNARISEVLASTEIDILEARACSKQLLQCEVCDAAVPIQFYWRIKRVLLPILFSLVHLFASSMSVRSEISRHPFRLSSYRLSGSFAHSKCSSVRGVNSKLRCLRDAPLASKCTSICFTNLSMLVKLLVSDTR